MTISPVLFPAVNVTAVRDRKIRTALRTNQIAGFVTVHSWKKINKFYVLVVGTISFLPLEHEIHIFSPPCNILYLLNCQPRIMHSRYTYV